MILSPRHTIEDSIVEILAKKPHISGPVLVSEIQLIRQNTTKQAVYLALSHLLSDEVVAKTGQNYFVTKTWTSRLKSLFLSHTQNELKNDLIFSLPDGKSVSYKFTSLLSCDTYWGHLFSILTEATDAQNPITCWFPHQIFGIVRTGIEKQIFESFITEQKYVFYTTQGTSRLDADFKKNWRSDHVAINTDSSLPYPDSVYISIFNEYIIEVFLDGSLAKDIETVYQSHTVVTATTITEMEQAISAKHSIRMKISRDTKRAAKIRKRLLRDFYVPEHLVVS
jgi:hypothetical protein